MQTRFWLLVRQVTGKKILAGLLILEIFSLKKVANLFVGNWKKSNFISIFDVYFNVKKMRYHFGGYYFEAIFKTLKIKSISLYIGLDK